MNRKKNDENYYNEKLTEAKYFYSKLRTICCPALNNEEIHINAQGIKHLIRKGRMIRSKSDQIRRFNLLKYIEPVLSDLEVRPIIRKEEKIESFKYRGVVTNVRREVTFWTFNKSYKDRLVTIIIRQFQGGKKHFFSIMVKK